MIGRTIAGFLSKFAARWAAILVLAAILVFPTSSPSAELVGANIGRFGDWSVRLEVREGGVLGMPGAARCTLRLRSDRARLEISYTQGGVRPGARLVVRTSLETGLSDGDAGVLSIGEEGGGVTTMTEVLRWGAVHAVDLGPEEMLSLVDALTRMRSIATSVGQLRLTWRAQGGDRAAAAYQRCVENLAPQFIDGAELPASRRKVRS